MPLTLWPFIQHRCQSAPFAPNLQSGSPAKSSDTAQRSAPTTEAAPSREMTTVVRHNRHRPQRTREPTNRVATRLENLEPESFTEVLTTQLLFKFNGSESLSMMLTWIFLMIQGRFSHLLCIMSIRIFRTIKPTMFNMLYKQWMIFLSSQK